MSERTSLDFDGVSSTPIEPIEISAVDEVAQRSGFGAKAGSANSRQRRSQKPKFKRPRTPRVHSFSARVDRETLQTIYDYAEARGCTVGETMARMAELLRNDL